MIVYTGCAASLTELAAGTGCASVPQERILSAKKSVDKWIDPDPPSPLEGRLSATACAQLTSRLSVGHAPGGSGRRAAGSLACCLTQVSQKSSTRLILASMASRSSPPPSISLDFRVSRFHFLVALKSHRIWTNVFLRVQNLFWMSTTLYLISIRYVGCPKNFLGHAKLFFHVQKIFLMSR